MAQKQWYLSLQAYIRDIDCMDITVAWIRESKQGNVSGLCQPCRRSGLDSIAALQIIVVDIGGVGFACVDDSVFLNSSKRHARDFSS